MVNYPNMKKTTVHQTKLIDGKLNTRHRGTEFRRRFKFD